MQTRGKAGASGDPVIRKSSKRRREAAEPSILPTTEIDIFAKQTSCLKQLHSCKTNLDRAFAENKFDGSFLLLMGTLAELTKQKMELDQSLTESIQMQIPQPDVDASSSSSARAAKPVRRTPTVSSLSPAAASSSSQHSPPPYGTEQLAQQPDLDELSPPKMLTRSHSSSATLFPPLARTSSVHNASLPPPPSVAARRSPFTLPKRQNSSSQIDQSSPPQIGSSSATQHDSPSPQQYAQVPDDSSPSMTVTRSRAPSKPGQRAK